MESSQTSELSKYQRAANSILGLITGLNYEFFSPVELQALVFLVNHIRVIPSDEISGFRLTKLTESHFIFKRLKVAYSERAMQETMKELLIEYEHWEILAVLEI